MNTVKFLVVGATTLLALSTGLVIAEDAKVLGTQTEAQIRTETEGQFYGRQLMTDQERVEHGAKLRAAKTVEEREQIRHEHHEKMKIRAKERGVTIPDEPLKQGRKNDCINKGQGAGKATSSGHGK